VHTLGLLRCNCSFYIGVVVKNSIVSLLGCDSNIKIVQCMFIKLKKPSPEKGAGLLRVPPMGASFLLFGSFLTYLKMGASNGCQQ
jgi:hypothetical protein